MLTLNIDANDQLAAVHKCEGEVGEEFKGEGKNEPGSENEKGYNAEKGEYEPGPGESKYNKTPFTTKEKEETETHTPTHALSHCLEAHLGEVFGHIAQMVAGIDITIRSGSGFCVNVNKLPCDAGHKGVNYTGKMTFLGGYDPFGSVFEENKELLEKSNTLVGLLNSNLASVNGKFGVCTANPQPAFNPKVIGKPEEEWGEGEFGSLISTLHGGKPDGMGGIEPDPSPVGTLQHYTNMANFSTATKGNKLKNGPGTSTRPRWATKCSPTRSQSQCP